LKTIRKENMNAIPRPQNQFDSSKYIAQQEYYSFVPGHKNWQIETAVWNWAGYFTEGLEPRWQRYEQFLNDL